MKLFLMKFLAFYGACQACSILQNNFGFSPILSSAIIGFAGSFYALLAPIIYAGSFAGTTSREYLSEPYHFLFISIVGTGIYFFSKPHLSGFGGKLGAIAFLASCMLVFTRSLW